MSSGKMRSVLVVGCALSAFVLGGCSVYVAPAPVPSVTSLTISNSSSKGIEFVAWSGIGFNEPNAVYEPVLGYYVEGIPAGHSVGRDVNPGSDYVYFEDPGNATDWRTVEIVSVASGYSATFTFIDTTQGVARAILIVTSPGGETNSRTLELAPAVH